MPSETAAARPDPPTGSTAGASPGLCRDCGAATRGERCPECRGPRIVRHDELLDLPIAHLDCDAFYAAIEKRDRPELADVPVVIGGERRGVVSTACYIARIKGIHSAMPMFKARKLCPEAVVIRPDMAKYVAESRRIRTLMRELTPLVEPLSIDEAFLDLSGTERLHQRSPASSMLLLARRIEAEIGITVSIGLSHNKYLAKLASDLDKPRGFSVIGRAETVAFLARRPVTDIWGVGDAAERRLRKEGIRTLADLQAADANWLRARFGKLGERLHHLAFGRDTRRVTPPRGAKSISSETTFSSDIADPAELERRLWRQCERVATRAKINGHAGRTAVLKLKTADFRIRTRNQRLGAASQLADDLYRATAPLLRAEADGTAFRLLGVGFTDLVDAKTVPAAAPDLFGPEAEKRADVERALDSVRARFGDDAIGKGRGLRG